MVNTFYVLNTFVCTPNCSVSAHEYNEGTISGDGYFFRRSGHCCVSLKYPSRVTIPSRLCTRCVPSDGGHDVFLSGKAMCGEKCNLCCFYLLNIYMKSWSKNRIDLLIANQQISQMYYSTCDAKTNPWFLFQVWLFLFRQGLEIPVSFKIACVC